MKIKIQKNFKEFKTMWEKTISKICAENTISVTKEALEIKFTSPTNTLMCKFRLTADAFEEYEVSDDGENINIITEVFTKYLKNCNKELTLQTISSRLVLMSGKKIFRMGILDEIEERPFKEPQQYATGSDCTLNISDLSEAIKDTKLMSEITRMFLTSDKLVFKSSNDTDEVETELALIENKTTTDETVNIKTEFLEQITNPAFDTIVLNIGKENPLVFKCEKEMILYEGVIAPNTGE